MGMAALKLVMYYPVVDAVNDVIIDAESILGA